MRYLSLRHKSPLVAIKSHHRSFSLTKSLNKAVRTKASLQVELSHIGRSVELKERGSGLLWASNTGAQLWDGARVLADYISDPAAHPLLGNLKGKRVVELGCGLGLVSITAALLGARVIATDGDSGVLRAARGNVARNSEGCRHAVHVQRLQYGDATGVGALGLGEYGADLVLGSDLVYGSNPGVWERLMVTLRELLQTPHSVALLTNCFRLECAYEPFYEALAASGFAAERVPFERLGPLARASRVELGIIRRTGLS